MRPMISLAMMPSLLLGCPAADDTATDPGWTVVSQAEVQAAVEAGCSAESLAVLEGAEPAAVRALLVELDSELKLAEWTPGISHDHPMPAVELQTELLHDFDFSYSLHVPEGYTADPEQPLPLYLNPGHPVDDVQDDLTLPYMDNLIDQPVFLFQDNYFNTLYTELGQDGYYDQVYYNPDFSLVASYQDHLEMVGGIIAELTQRYHIDSSRIYVGGVSAEGNASWSHGIQISDRWAAILPVSAGTAGYDEQLWRNLENVGILAVHGTEDELCAVEDVDETVQMLEGWGFDVEYWRYEGEGHGTMFYSDWDLMVDWLLERQRPLQPARVHKAIKSPRNTGAYWLRATAVDAAVSDDVDMYPEPPPAVVDASWEGAAVTLETTGVQALELYWMEGAAGPASGSAGDDITVTANGSDLGAFTLEEDPTVAVEAYCRSGDIQRAWAGRVTLALD
jgi:poly(3-hydroxybutyrate) depolymerase